MPRCNIVVVIGHRRDQSLIEVECGTYVGGRKVLCDRCTKDANHRYPQGWRAYPGDTCKHGVYVGGCGVDVMCGACEGGE